MPKSKTTKANATKAKGPVRRNPRREKKPIPVPAVITIVEPNHLPTPPPKPLTYEEQEAVAAGLTDLPDQLLPRVEEIFKKAGLIGDNEDEIDIDINELDISSQRELQRLVMEATSYNNNNATTTSYQDLTYVEQEALTAAINNLSEEDLPGVIDILRRAGRAPMDKDDESLDLELDELDTQTQRELQRFVAHNTKPRRVSDISAFENDGVTQVEFNNLFVMLQSVQNDIAQLTEELTRR